METIERTHTLERCLSIITSIETCKYNIEGYEKSIENELKKDKLFQFPGASKEWYERRIEENEIGIEKLKTEYNKLIIKLSNRPLHKINKIKQSVSNNEAVFCECSNPEGTPVNKIKDKWICCVCNRPLAN